MAVCASGMLGNRMLQSWPSSLMQAVRCHGGLAGLPALLSLEEVQPGHTQCVMLCTSLLQCHAWTPGSMAAAPCCVGHCCLVASTFLLLLVMQARDCWSVAFGNAHTDDERCVLAGYDNGDVKLFDLRMGRQRWSTNLRNGVCSVAFDRRGIPQNKFVAACLESRFHVFDARTQHPKQVCMR